ncbi:hypothetical protein HK405_006044, partial [Cladochytrium tenue]
MACRKENSSPTQPRTSLIYLPNDVLSDLIVLLDPIAAIALSQTSRDLRAFVAPTRQHFLQRLLALELLPEHNGGGLVPLLAPRRYKIDPSWDDADAWASMRYACAGCMKLLSHSRFDNHSILSLAMRKPPPGSDQANALIEWQPPDRRASFIADPKAHWSHIHAIRAHAKQQEKRWRCQYAEAPVWPEDLISAAESHVSGIHRDRRLCIECRFHRGDWRRTNALSKLVPVQGFPIIRSRQLPFATVLDRFFPGFFEPLPIALRPRLTLVYRMNATVRFFALYASRCPGCSKWYEISGFRGGDESNLLDIITGEPLKMRTSEPLLCNRCYCQRHGRAQLERALINAVHATAEFDRSQA